MSIFPILILAALVAVVIVLLLGLVNMARGGNPKTSNKLMQLRVAVQAVAIVIILVALWAARSG